MTLDHIKNYCQSKRGTTEEYPFGPETMVFKVMNKMYALITMKDALIRINLKCDPELALVLRQQYDNVIEGYHMNKKHWNTVLLPCEDLPVKELHEMIDHSYDLVVSKLKVIERQELELD